jgi:hypothetical protein
MKEQFNIFHFLAGAFVPAWLLSRSEISPGAKLAYTLLAQQANSRGVVQVNFQMTEAALGEHDGRLARYLIELERCGLIQSSRGNVQMEDIRIYFLPHRWMSGLVAIRDESANAVDVISEQQGTPAAARPVLREVKEEKPPAEVQQASLPTITGDTRSERRKRKGRRRWGRPRSKHSYEICHRFAVYNVEVLKSKTIYDLDGFTDYLHRTGEQDAEIDEWLSEQANAA